MMTIYSLLLLVFMVPLTSCYNADYSLTSSDIHRMKRMAIHPNRWRNGLWPGAVVPFEISGMYSAYEKSVIYAAMVEFHKVTCIRFRPRTNGDRYYISIQKYMNTEQCFAYIGRQMNNQYRTREGNYMTMVRLAPNCLRGNGRGTAMHELMHTLGFYHEHQREDRDVRINRYQQNYNYRVYSRRESYYIGSYDRTSIMHYNFPGITYSRSYFSGQDIWRINTLYRCVTKTPNFSSKSSQTNHVDKDSDFNDNNEIKRKLI